VDQHRPPAAPAGAELDERAGWYEVEGHCVLLTYSARGGLALVGPTEPLYFHHWVHLTGDRFRWDLPGEAGSRTVTFGQGSGGFSWHDPAGGTGRAERCSGPYRVREVAYEQAETRLVATLFLPDGMTAKAGAVVVHGSGTSDRDNLWYLQIVHALAADGVAVLFPDKRGSGGSGGEWRTASFDLLAADAAAGVVTLASVGGIEPGSITVLGISQGGHIAPLVAEAAPGIGSVVNLSGGAVTMDESLRHESVATLVQKGWPRPLARLVEPVASAVPKRRTRVWWQLNGAWDPIPHWGRLEVPALVVYGAEDELDNVPVARSVERLREADRASSGSITIEVIPGAGHGFFAPDRRHVRADVLELLGAWIRDRGAGLASP
jgi:dienelactone hydrolase